MTSGIGKLVQSKASEPRALHRPLPVWLPVFAFLLICWGMLYFDQHGGWFSKEVYTPFHSGAELEELNSSFRPQDCISRGKKLFQQYCAVCHRDTGLGNGANGCPPLLGSEWVSSPGIGRLTRIISKGLTDPISVRGQVYATGSMPAIGDQIPGDEREKSEKIAAIICYVKKAFANMEASVTPEQVLEIRVRINQQTAAFPADKLQDND